MTARKSSLGRNLNVFLSNTKAVKKEATNGETENSELTKLSITSLQPGIYQPRKDMTEQGLTELAESIKQQGLLQPIVARAIAKDKYEIIAGERRWRASTLAGLTEVPVIIHEVDDKTSLAMAIVENIQREDLNPIEEARALARLISEFDLTHLQASEVVGKSRASVSNLLRLMSLHQDVQMMLERGDIEMGHARALLALEEKGQLALAREIVDKNYTVRETEAAVRRILSAVDSHNKVGIESNKKQANNVLAQKYQQRLSKQLSGKVKVKAISGGKFKVEIMYAGVDDLERFIDSMPIVDVEQ